MDDVIAFGVPFALGIVGTLLIEWRFRPRFERKRRAQERWENELKQLLELLEIRLPRLTEELNHLLRMAKHHADIKEAEDLSPQQLDALDHFAERDREGAQRAYEAWAEVAETVAVLSRRVARFHRPDATTYEVSGWLYSRHYFREVSDFRMGEIPSGDYEQQEKKMRERLQGWAESLLREGRPHKAAPRRPSVRPEELVTHVTRCRPRRETARTP